MARTRFELFLDEELSRLRGIWYPVRAGFFRQAFINSVSLGRLHPNPNDEFCSPDIGPNYEIMSRYQEAYRSVRDDPVNLQFLDSPVREPLEIQRIHPDGYMILNGHHRWGAAIQAGMPRLPVRIIDLTQEKDVRKMLNAAGFDRRVTLDLDEVVLRPESDPCLEKPLAFPLDRIYRERLRLGIPSLFHMMNSSGYDIWVYSARYCSLNYLRYYFRHYRIHVTGIVTGLSRKGPSGTDTRKELEKRIASRYKSTVHISENTVLCTCTGSRDFQEFRLSGSPETWSREVTDVFEEMRKHE